MAFARSLTGISFHPCILNILLLIPHDENKAWSLMLPPEEQYKLRVSDNRAKQLWNRLVKGGK